MQRPQQETEGIVNRPIAAEFQVTGKLISQIRPIAEKGRGCWLCQFCQKFDGSKVRHLHNKRVMAHEARAVA